MFVYVRDPYVDEHGVLKNKLGFTTQEELAREEADLAAFERAVIISEPPRSVFDSRLLAYLHKRLFGDVYTWAGK